jgi:hypothetical protein
MTNPVLRDRATLESNLLTGLDYTAYQSGTANAAGTVLAQIAANKRVVMMDSANDAHFVTLPATPVIGQIIRIINWDAAQDFRVTTYTVNHTINGVVCSVGIGGGTGILMGQCTAADFICVSATAWICMWLDATVGLPQPS